MQSASGLVNTESAAANLPQNQLAQNQANVPLLSRNVTNLDVVKAKDPVPAQTASGAASSPSIAFPNVPLQTSPALMLKTSPRWTVTSSGALQRSFDGGTTWQNVDPAASSSVPLNRPATQVSNSTAAAQAAPANADARAYKDKKAQSSPAFRVVAASGLEVWAGGSAGLLFHTGDGGNHWTQVTVSSGGASLTGDIVGIEFVDPQHGKLTTSTAESWTTSDTGETWQKQ